MSEQGRLIVYYVPPAWRAAIRQLRDALPRQAVTVKPPSAEGLIAGVKVKLRGNVRLLEYYDLKFDMIRGYAEVYYELRQPKPKSRRKA